MNRISFISFFVSLSVLALCVEAMPQRAHIDPPPPQPTYSRAKRQVLGGSLASNPAGGADARVDLTKAIGDPQHNIIAQAFAAGNTDHGPSTSGGTVAYNNNGLGLDLTKTNTPGVRDTFMQSAHANLFNDGTHNFDAKAFASQNQLANGLKFDRNGVGIDYSHINGHGASVTHSNIPNFGKQLELAGKANLWSSADHNTRLDLGGTASKWMSGPLSGQKDFGANLGLTHFFGL